MVQQVSGVYRGGAPGADGINAAGRRKLAIGRIQEQSEKRLPLYFAVFGLRVFMMAWETNRRYFTNFAPVIIACGVLAVPGGG